ncbi:MAG: hypothetical protein WAR76_11620 [Xanthobacteraceae bacterium]
MSDTATLLLTDLYQLNMIKTYLDHDQVKTAVFEFFVRKLPTRRGFLVAAGLEQAIDFLENFQFSAEELRWLDRTGRFGRDLLAHLGSFRFTGEVRAMPEVRSSLQTNQFCASQPRCPKRSWLRHGSLTSCTSNL